MNKTPVITRFAPSPTGPIHLGTLRIAVFNYLFAKKHQGKFIIRFEDTDTERSENKYEEETKEILKWLNIIPDECYRQSERNEKYKEALKDLIDSGKAYISKEEKVVGEGQSNLIRFKNPKKKISFNDVVRGEINTDISDLGDFIIAKDMDTPLYHLASVVDDADMGVTHIIRGEDHISNTPRQIALKDALNLPQTTYAHVSLTLSKEGGKLSKREMSASFDGLKKEYLPDALLNFAAFLGWNPGGTREVFSREDLIKEFSLEGLQKGSSFFSMDKLNWFNVEHIKSIDNTSFCDIIIKHIPENIKNMSGYSEGAIKKISSDIKGRVKLLSDINKVFSDGSYDFLFYMPTLDIKEIKWKDTSAEKTRDNLIAVRDILKNMPENKWNIAEIENALDSYASKEGKGQVLWPLRYTLSGRAKSPSPFMIAFAVGKKETLVRIDNAIDLLWAR
ncbi:MAG: glutamate--tRNA ligase family protein [Candidatus Campbellbacteria bacterium]|nr:glutamate--tRNA ligase family protein [Candidatus Campbellbacteria bacterium]